MTQSLLDHLDALSRTRALTDEESLLLESLINQEAKGLAPYASRREQARCGIKRRRSR